MFVCARIYSHTNTRTCTRTRTHRYKAALQVDALHLRTLCNYGPLPLFPSFPRRMPSPPRSLALCLSPLHCAHMCGHTGIQYRHPIYASNICTPGLMIGTYLSIPPSFAHGTSDGTRARKQGRYCRMRAKNLTAVSPPPPSTGTHSFGCVYGSTRIETVSGRGVDVR